MTNIWNEEFFESESARQSQSDFSQNPTKNPEIVVISGFVILLTRLLITVLQQVH